MAADVKFTIQFDSNGVPVMRGISGALEGAKKSAEGLAAPMEKFASVAAQMKSLQFADRKADSPLVVDLDKQNQAIVMFDRNARRVANANLDAAFKEIQHAAIAATPAIESADRSLKTVLRSAASSGAMLADIGPGGRIAAQALTAMAAASGPVALAFGAVAGAIAFVNSRIEAAREKFRNLAEREMKDIERASNDLKLDQALRGQITILQSLEPELETIRQKYDQLTIAAQKTGASQDTVARIATVAQLEQNKILNARQEAAGKAQQTILNEIAGRQFEAAAIGRSGSALDALSLAQRLNAIETRRLKGEHGALLDQLTREEQAVFALKSAFRQLDAGRQGVTDFQNQFGVTFDFEGKLAADALANKFAAVFHRFKGDRNAQQQLSAAFSSLVEQAVQLGVPDVGELLVSKLGSANFERLRATLGPELRAALDQSAQAGQQWGQTLVEETRAVFAASAEVGKIFEAIAHQQNAIRDAVAAPLAAQMDVSQPLRALDEWQRRIDAIPDVVRKSIVFDVFYAMSPQRPFSEFVPAVQSIFSRLQQIVPSSTPDILFDLPNLRERLAKIDSLQNTVAENTGISAIPTRATDLNAWWYRQNRQDTAYSASQSIAALQTGIAWDVATAQSRAPASRGGGSGAVVNIDMRGALVTMESLDALIIPALERGIIRATGQNPEFRINN